MNKLCLDQIKKWWQTHNVDLFTICLSTQHGPCWWRRQVSHPSFDSSPIDKQTDTLTHRGGKEETQGERFEYRTHSISTSTRTSPYIDEYNMGLGPKKPIRVCLFFSSPFPLYILRKEKILFFLNPRLCCRLRVSRLQTFRLASRGCLSLLLLFGRLLISKKQNFIVYSCLTIWSFTENCITKYIKYRYRVTPV